MPVSFLIDLHATWQITFEKSSAKKCPPCIEKWLERDKQTSSSSLEHLLQTLSRHDNFNKAAFEGSILKT